jgi:hypothetical protein
MTKSADAPYIAAPIAELPPRNAAEARERARQEANAAAFFAGGTLPPGTDHAAILAFIERHNELVEDGNRFMLEIAATGVIDRARLRWHLEAYGQTRRQLLLAVGADPDSDDLLPFPAVLHDS